MARSISEIKKEIGSAFVQNSTVIVAYGLAPGVSFEEQFSDVSLEAIIFGIIAFVVWTLENLFDLHKVEVDNIIENTKVGYVPDLRNRILNFQFGYDLVQDEIFYNNEGLTDDVIAASKVVKYVAIVELTRGLLVKVAGISGNDLARLTNAQEAALAQYVASIKPPGVGIRIVNKIADSLKLEIDVYYNPLILDSSGKRLDGSNDSPIQTAIDTFLKNQPFNGQYILTRQERAIENVDGVVIARVSDAQANYESVGFIPFEVLYLPDSGYLRFANPADLILNFIPHENL